ncbi:MAG: HPF/RaiA family ribosome-associated protein [Candidatus Pacebacteria bacterium]|nr:HPF/RaiA family ribosome-associated protein [Candidatus Paceibacterota bacterium]
MKINIKFTGTEADDALRAYAEEKVLAFAKLLPDEAMEASVCDIEFKQDAHHQSGDVCYAEVTLEAEGKVYRASKVEQTFEKAIDKVKDDVLQELRVEKQKNEHHFMKGAQQVKEMMRSDN